MPTATGTSVKGRQVILNSAPATTNFYLELANTEYLRKGYLELVVKRNTVNIPMTYQGIGGAIWYRGIRIGTPAIPAGTTFDIVVWWQKAGYTWTLNY